MRDFLKQLNIDLPKGEHYIYYPNANNNINERVILILKLDIKEIYEYLLNKYLGVTCNISLLLPGLGRQLGFFYIPELNINIQCGGYYTSPNKGFKVNKYTLDPNLTIEEFAQRNLLTTYEGIISSIDKDIITPSQEDINNKVLRHIKEEISSEELYSLFKLYVDNELEFAPETLSLLQEDNFSYIPKTVFEKYLRVNSDSSKVYKAIEFFLKLGIIDLEDKFIDTQYYLDIINTFNKNSYNYRLMCMLLFSITKVVKENYNWADYWKYNKQHLTQTINRLASIPIDTKENLIDLATLIQPLRFSEALLLNKYTENPLTEELYDYLVNKARELNLDNYKEYIYRSNTYFKNNSEAYYLIAEEQLKGNINSYSEAHRFLTELLNT